MTTEISLTVAKKGLKTLPKKEKEEKTAIKKTMKCPFESFVMKNNIQYERDSKFRQQCKDSECEFLHYKNPPVPCKLDIDCIGYWDKSCNASHPIRRMAQKRICPRGGECRFFDCTLAHPTLRMICPNGSKCEGAYLKFDDVARCKAIHPRMEDMVKWCKYRYTCFEDRCGLRHHPNMNKKDFITKNTSDDKSKEEIKNILN